MELLLQPLRGKRKGGGGAEGDETGARGHAVKRHHQELPPPSLSTQLPLGLQPKSLLNHLKINLITELLSWLLRMHTYGRGTGSPHGNAAEGTPFCIVLCFKLIPDFFFKRKL